MPGGRSLFRWLYLIGLGIIAVSLPTSYFGMSLGQFWVLGAWLLEGLQRRDLGHRFSMGFTTPAVLAFLGYLILHAIGLLWTENMGWGLDLCRILLPILLLGIVLSTSDPLGPKELRTILLLFAWSAVVGSLIGFLITSDAVAPGAYRDRSPFISHIRLGLMLVLAVVVLLHHWPRPWWKRAGHLLGVGVCLFLLRELGSLQGALLLFLLAWAAVWRTTRRSAGWSRWGVRLLLVMPVAVVLLQVRTAIIDQRHPQDFVPGRMSAGGELYWNDEDAWQVENGHPVWMEVAPVELARAWRARTGLPLNGRDARGEPLYGTLVRYMASKHLTKDSVGMLSMSDVDLQHVQQGFVNVDQDRRGPLRRRIDEVVYELDRFHHTGDVTSSSLAMRLEFWRTGLYLAQRHWVIGVGTGDTQLAFDRAYEELGSSVVTEWGYRGHQQYLTLWISFGVFGFLLAMVSWVAPAVITGGWRHPVYLAFAFIFLVSCFTDDTLETQPGATFYAFFQALFLFAVRRKAD